MSCDNIFEWAASAIFTLVFSSSAVSINYVVHRSLITWIITHLVENTSVQFEGSAGMQVVIVVWHNALERHADIRARC